MRGRLMATAACLFFFCVTALQHSDVATSCFEYKDWHLERVPLGHGEPRRGTTKSNESIDKVSAHSVHMDKRPLPSMP